MSTATPTTTTTDMSSADELAHQAASYVRRPAIVPVQDSPKPPTDPAARRRFIQQREW